MSGHVRRAVPADAAALHALQRYLPSPAPALLDAALAGTLGDLFVAVADAPVGYVLAVDGDPPVPSGAGPIPTEGSQRHVAELVVAPSARRRGHASALLATLLADRPDATLTLTVDPNNTAARALYDRFGFTVVRELPGFFDGDPGLLLVRRPRAE